MTPKTLPAPIVSPVSIKALRSAIAVLGSRSSQEVGIVRTAFVTGKPPIQSFSSGSKSDFINRFAPIGLPSNIVKSTAQFGLHTAIVHAVTPVPRPELDFIEVGTDRTLGVLDCFFARIVFSLSMADSGRISHYRILRSRSGRVRAPTPAFSAMAELSPLGAKTKSREMSGNSAFRAAALGVGNALTNFTPVDSFSGQRVVVSSSSLRPLPPVQNTNRRSNSTANLLSLPNGDRSVVENATFFVNQRSITTPAQFVLPLSVGNKSGTSVLRGSSVGNGTSIVTSGNSQGFSEIARVAGSKGRQVGSFFEFEYVDSSVVYGAGYSYYVVAVSTSGLQSVRSRMIPIEVIRSVPPVTPSVMFAVLGNVPRFSISCSGSFTDHIEVFRRGGPTPTSIQLLSTGRAMIDRGPSVRTDSGFNHIGDIGVGSSRAGTFVDRNVSPGQKLDYRIYSVDSFGLKSSTPFSCSISLPDIGRPIPLGTPSITAEQTSADRVIRVTLLCDDSRVSSFVVSRKELTTREHTFQQPTVPAYFTFGRTTPLRSRSRSGPALGQFSLHAWNGVLQSISGSAVLDDSTVEFDRVYQYSVHGVDIRGNITSNVSSTPVFVGVKPISDAPVGLTGTLVVDEMGSPTAVIIEWIPGTIDFSPSEIIGDQGFLAANSQRSVYQVERKVVGDHSWNSMPATTESHFIDRISSIESPSFRPSFALPNTTYDYRVIAMQSGAFISVHTDPVRVSVVPEMLAPPVLFVRSSQMGARPLSITVSWEYDGIFVDTWEVQRAVTNKLFGGRIPSMDSPLVQGLSFSGIASVTRESSRGLGISATDRLLDPMIFVGNRSFVDRNVSLANSYFYRVRAVSQQGRKSPWVLGGILLTDSPFDRKFMSALSDDDRSRLPLDPRPIDGWENE